MLEMILTKDVDNLGRAGDLVRVKPGYGRNFLIPQGLAVLATERNVRLVEHHKKVIAARNAKLQKDAQAVADKLSSLHVRIERQTGEGGKLYGSISTRDIEDAVRALGVTVWSMDRWEADDALATGAKRFRDEVEQVRIMTPDKDLGQCVDGTRVVQFDRRKRAMTDAQGKITIPSVPGGYGSFAVFAQVVIAFTVLTDPHRRREYVAMLEATRARARARPPPDWWLSCSAMSMRAGGVRSSGSSWATRSAWATLPAISLTGTLSMVCTAMGLVPPMVMLPILTVRFS